MKEFRNYQKRRRLQEKQKQKNLPSDCNKQFPDCPEKPNKKDCKTCPFYKGENKESNFEMKDGVTGRTVLKNPLNKRNLSDEELDDIML